MNKKKKQSQTIFSKVKSYFIQYLIKQVNPIPLLFLMLYIYGLVRRMNLGLQKALSTQGSSTTGTAQTESESIQYTLFILGTIFSFLFRYNHFFYYSAILNQGLGYWSILNLIFGLIAINQKWKFCLYLFLTVDILTLEYIQLQNVFLICCAGYITIDCYKNLIFRNIEQNIFYFVMFFTVTIFELTRKVISQIQSSYTLSLSFFTVPFSILVSYKLIIYRIQKLKLQKIQQLKNPNIIQHYINLMKEQFQSQYVRQGYLEVHIQKCQNLGCFCKRIDFIQKINNKQNNYLDINNFKNNKNQNQQIQGKNVKIQFRTQIQYYLIRNLYSKAISIPKMVNKSILQYNFIRFLLKNNQLTQAISLFAYVQPNYVTLDYFSYINRLRLRSLILQKLYESYYFNEFQNQYVYVFQYDNSYLHLASQIKQILKDKVQFWLQVGKQTPLMLKLQQKGSQIVDKMYNLNNFYFKKIKAQQQTVNNFNGTIMYAMYLLSTTNYKQFAETLIKNTSRSLQSIKIHEDNIAQTYGIKVTIEDLKKSVNQKIQAFQSVFDGNLAQQLQKYNKYQQQKDYQKSAKRLQKIQKTIKNIQIYEQVGSINIKQDIIEIITNISGSLCKLLKTTKNQMIGMNLNRIIPSKYVFKHSQRIRRLLYHNIKNKNTSFQQQQFQQILTYQFINKIRIIPVKILNSTTLISVKINIKVCDQMQDGMTFIAIIQTLDQNKVSLITNFNKQVQQVKEGQFQIQAMLNLKKIIDLKQIDYTLKQMKQQWQNTHKITQKKISISYRDENYSVVISSPFYRSYIPKNNIVKPIQKYKNKTQQQQNKQIQTEILQYPPIHIQLSNQTVPFTFASPTNNQQQMTRCINKLQSVFYKTDIDSQTSTSSSRKTSVVNVLMTFSQNIFIPFYNYIICVFAIVLTIGIVSNTMGYNNFRLGWDVKIEQNNPFNNILSLMDIRSILIQTYNQQIDLDQFMNNDLLNKTNIIKFIQVNLDNVLIQVAEDKYVQFIKQKMLNLRILYHRAIQLTTMYVSSILKQNIQDALSKKIVTFNKNNPNLLRNKQILSIQNLLINYYVDIALLQQGKQFNKTLISYNFWQQVQQKIDDIKKYQNIVSQQINNIILINIIFVIITVVIILILTIPIIILFKSRVKKHIDIYDLIVSVQGFLIHDQVIKLKNIIKIVNNSNQSSQVLKTNTINYLARKRAATNSNNQHNLLIVGSNQRIQGMINQEQKNQLNKTNQLGIKSNLASSEGFRQNSKQKMNVNFNLNNQSDLPILKLRKRTGQLLFDGSQGDTKKFILKHWSIYFMIILSFISLVAIIVIKVESFKNIQSKIKILCDFYENSIDQSLLLLNTKLYYRGKYQPKFLYKGKTFEEWMKQNIYKNNAILFNSPFKDNQILQNCANDTLINYNNHLFCQQPYSIRLIRLDLSNYVKITYQHKISLNQKYNITQINNNSTIPQNQLSAFSQNLFYAQTMNNDITQSISIIIKSQLNSLVENQEKTNNQLRSIYSIGLTLSVCFLLIGIFLLNYMRKLYFKQIIIVSFLNTQMISRNKRVESFLQMLSKSAY